MFFASPDRRGERPRAHLAAFSGVLQADGWAGFNGLYEGGRIVEAACWAHTRREFFDVHAATGSAVAQEALERTGALYDVERSISGKPRRATAAAAGATRPLADALKGLGRDDPAAALRRRRAGLCLQLHAGTMVGAHRAFDDGRLALDNNPGERTLRGVAIGRKNYLFAGSERGAERAAD